jgi:hypothetical protein
MPLGEALFGEMRCFFGVLPRFDVLNGDLRQGRSWIPRTDCFNGLDLSFRLPNTKSSKQEVLSHPEWETDVDETFSGTIEEWSHWALVRAISK